MRAAITSGVERAERWMGKDAGTNAERNRSAQMETTGVEELEREDD
jgi:hypothetical protein